MSIRNITKDGFRRLFSNKFLCVALLAIILIPVLFGTLYIIAFWDPQGRMADIPVAIVNMDEGAVRDGKPVNYGEDVLDQVKDNDDVAWEIIDQDILNDGIEHTDYY
ncbi:MAG: YhgE/Pip family protein, partial [Bacillota bacterium]|nr:YhgE/Pip family protein [Bacillota bacterium]